MKLEKTVFINKGLVSHSLRGALIAGTILFCLSGSSGEPAITGHVLDSRGSPVPGGSVLVHRILGEGPDTTIQTAPQGQFMVDALLDGEYMIRAQASGFVSVSYEPVHVQFPNRLTY